MVVNTDSKVTLDTLQNRHKLYIIIKKEIKRLEDLRWTAVYSWVKARVGIQGNELADHLAKKAATDDKGEILYDKIPQERLQLQKGRRT